MATRQHPTDNPARWRKPAHVLLAVFGGYAAVAATAACLALGLILVFGLHRGDAFIISTLLGFLLYLVSLVWAFSRRSLKRLFLILMLWSVLAFALANVLATYGPAAPAAGGS